MSKQAVKKKASGRDLQVVSGGVSAAIAERMKKSQGRGLSTDSSDNLVPLIYILQSGSPQVKKRDPAYIEGAEPGMFWLKNAQDPLVDGDDGIVVQPCTFYKKWVEWIPRDSGGGFVASHDECPSEARKVPDPKDPKKVKFIMPNGNEIKETRYHVVLVHREDMAPAQYVFPMSGTGHSSSKGWMSAMNNKQYPGVGRTDSWFQLWRLKTIPKSNNKGDWFGLAQPPEDAGWVDDVAILDLGEALHNAFEAGVKVAQDLDHEAAEEAASEI